jgi:hypothetical protein
MAAAALLAQMYAASAAAQDTGDGSPDSSRVRVRIGPLTINPTVALTNLGFDQNVFYEPADRNPKSDFTFTVVPKAEARLRVARTLLTGTASEELVWYQRYATERAANSRYRVGWDIPINRLGFKVNASRANVRDRPGFEIDARLQRAETAYDGSVEVRIMPKTFAGATARRERVDYDKAAVFLGRNLQFELNRVTTTTGVTLRYKLTPITSIALAATETRQRFEFSPLRDANASAATVSLLFDPFGIISGSATFGYTDFEPVDAGVSSFKGATGAVSVSYRLLGNTRVGFDATRDVGFSYEINEPYYVQTGFTASLARALYGRVDGVARAGLQTLAYRDRAGTIVQGSNRVDTIRTVGGGIGYHMGKGVRIGFNVDKGWRRSDVDGRGYDDLRFGSAVTYGF